MNFLGAPAKYVKNDISEQQDWLDAYHTRVKEAIIDGPPRQDVLPIRYFRSEYERLPSGVYWNVEYAIEAAIDELLSREQTIKYHFDGQPLEEILPNVAPIIEETREWISTVFDQLWKNAIPGLPDHIQGSAYPSLDGMVRIAAHGQISAVIGRATCPSCAAETDECHETITGRGFLQCQGCTGILADSKNQGLPFEDGIHVIDPGDVPLTAILHVLSQAKQDDSRFTVSGPADDWESGTLRIQALILDGEIKGFSTWNEFGGHPALRILWVKAAARNQGWGAKLVDVEASDLETFRVEAPNDACRAIFDRLGYFASKEILHAPSS